jgi:hypothetical protein
MTTVRTVLDKLTAAGVIVEVAEDGRLRLRACIDARPITADTRDLCRANKKQLLEYAHFANEADRLLLDSTTRIAGAWSDGCDALDDDPRWDDLELQVQQAYWSMEVDRLRYAIAERERYALAAIATKDQTVER